MKKFNILFAIASLLIFAQGAWAQDQEPHFKTVKDTDGTVLQDGSEDKPFLIESIKDLNNLAVDVNNGIDYEGVYFRQTKDITYGEDDTFTPIGMGDEENDGTPFKGKFDGDNNTISGITYSDPKGVGVGLFGYIYYPAVIKNVKLEHCSFTGNWEVGAIVGASSGHGDDEYYVIDNCDLGSYVKVNGVDMADGGETVPASYIGGIIGYAHCITVSNCNSDATVVSDGDFVGAIAGYLLGGPGNEAFIVNCYSSKAEKAVGGRGKEDGMVNDATDGILKITLFADDGEQTIKNATRLNSYNGQTANVTMLGLKLANDDKWSTICLPFEMSGFNGTPFAGADVKVFKAAEYKGNTLTATFEDASKIDVGIPYIVKGAAVDSPEFEGVKVGIEASAATFDHATFIGTFNPVTFNENDRTILYLGDDNKLYFPKEAMTINPFHAYFKLQNGIKACSSDGNVNGDENVTVADITSLVNIIKNPASQPEKVGVADVNDDNNVTVDDVAALANIILGKDIEGAMRAIKTDDAIGISYGFGGSSEKPAPARKM